MSFFINCLVSLHFFPTTNKLSHGSYSYFQTEMCHSCMNSASFHNQEEEKERKRGKKGGRERERERERDRQTDRDR